MFKKLQQNKFLFQQLVKRDFTKKYKRTILGMAWSIHCSAHEPFNHVVGI